MNKKNYNKSNTNNIFQNNIQKNNPFFKKKNNINANPNSNSNNLQANYNNYYRGNADNDYGSHIYNQATSSSNNLMSKNHEDADKYRLLQDFPPNIMGHPPGHQVSRKVNAASGRYLKLPSQSHSLAHEENTITGRVTVYATAKSYRKRLLRQYLHSFAEPSFFQDALYVKFPTILNQESSEFKPEVFYFDYGVLVCWGMTEESERMAIKMVEEYEVEKLQDEYVESDEFEFVVDARASPRILDDIITLVDITDLRMRLSISYALSQSCKLSVFEEMIDRTIDRYQSVPNSLANTGKVHMTRIEIAKVIGQLFMQTSQVNLVSNVLDTPDFFWEEPDHLERLYTAIRNYLEISKRVDVLNRRLSVVSDMMSILKDEQHQLHGEKLEWIVIWLIVAELVVGIIGIVVEIVLHFERNK